MGVYLNRGEDSSLVKSEHGLADYELAQNKQYSRGARKGEVGSAQSYSAAWVTLRALHNTRSCKPFIKGESRLAGATRKMRRWYFARYGKQDPSLNRYSLKPIERTKDSQNRQTNTQTQPRSAQHMPASNRDPAGSHDDAPLPSREHRRKKSVGKLQSKPLPKAERRPPRPQNSSVPAQTI